MPAETHFGKVCPRHPDLKGERRGRRNRCVGCERAKWQRWADKHREYNLQRQRDAYWKDPEKSRDAERQWSAANREQRSSSHRKWARKNPHVERAVSAASLARKHNTLPACLPDADRREIVEIYRRAREAGQTVDHVIPTRGCRCCKAVGLHVPASLQLLPLADNQAKGGRCQDCWDRSKAIPQRIAA